MNKTASGISKGPRISISEASCFSTVPEVPIYYPSESEFRDFATCMSLIERRGAQHMGLCKIIPPASWCPRRCGYDDVEVTIEKPILQLSAGCNGIYLQDVRAQKSMSFKKFEKASNSTKLQTPNYRTVKQLEDIYWKSIESLQPLYGANVSGSLTDADQPYCNIPKLRSTLSDILAQEDIEIGGVNTPYLYFGAWATTFAWHVEDMDLYSINYLHFGAPKLWYCIPPPFARKFEAFAREHFKPEFLACSSFLRHKSILIDPKVLNAAGIPTRMILQYEGEIMCTFPYGYHAGFNTGLNCAESTNFALPRWVEYGKRATICRCWDDTVRINMSPFVRRLQPDLFTAWQRGEDSSPHPLDKYSSCLRADACLSSSAASDDDSLLCAIGTQPVSTFGEDLNVPGLFYTQTELTRATLPMYLKRNPILQHLWCGFKKDLTSITQYNNLVGTSEPFCSICAFFWPPMVVQKALSGAQKVESLPIFSEPYLSEVAFCGAPSDFAKIQAKENPASRVYQCSQCKVIVHARCYGLKEYPVDASQSTSWKCEACCHADDEPQCVLCPIRGGVLKPLLNPCRSDTHRRFWVHLACAIAVGPQRCRFLSVERREPLLLPLPPLSGSLSTGKRTNQSLTEGIPNGRPKGRFERPPLRRPQFDSCDVKTSLTSVDTSTPEKCRCFRAPPPSRSSLSTSWSSLASPTITAQSPPRRGKPAKLARARGLGTPRLTISGRLGSPQWWSRSPLYSPPCSPSPTPDVFDDGGDRSTCLPKLRKRICSGGSHVDLQDMLASGCSRETRNFESASSQPPLSVFPLTNSTTNNNQARQKSYGSIEEDKSVVLVVSDSEDTCAPSPLESRQRSQRQGRLPSWTAQDYLVTRPRKISKRRRMSPADNQVQSATSSARTPAERRGQLTALCKVTTRDHCDECGLSSPGGAYLDLPLVPCWHDNCPGRVHLTCAQLSGVLIATGRYPYCFYVACRRHSNEYRQYEQAEQEEEEPLESGDSVYALYPGNGRYYNAVAMEPVVPRLCKVAFQDGTFSRDTPSDCVLGHDWRSFGPPKVGSHVQVRWKDGVEYPAVFQGASQDKWSVRFQNGQIIRLRRDKIFRVSEHIPAHIRRLIIR